MSTTAWYVADDVHAPGARISGSIGLRSERPQGTAATSVPSLGVTDDLGALTLRANYARAFRTPDLNDRYFPFAGNPALKPEYAATFDAGATAQFGAASATVSWFGVDTNNLIEFNPVTFVPVNIAKASVRGVEVAARVRDRRRRQRADFAIRRIRGPRISARRPERGSSTGRRRPDRPNIGDRSAPVAQGLASPLPAGATRTRPIRSRCLRTRPLAHSWSGRSDEVLR